MGHDITQTSQPHSSLLPAQAPTWLGEPITRLFEEANRLAGWTSGSGFLSPVEFTADGSDPSGAEHVHRHRQVLRLLHSDVHFEKVDAVDRMVHTKVKDMCNDACKRRIMCNESLR